MKGRSQFSAEDIEKIRALIHQKGTASRSAQKGIRAQMRELGFYISDFGATEGAFTERDLDRLIRSGRIQVVGESTPQSVVTTILAWWRRVIGRN